MARRAAKGNWEFDGAVFMAQALISLTVVISCFYMYSAVRLGFGLGVLPSLHSLAWLKLLFFALALPVYLVVWIQTQSAKNLQKIKLHGGNRVILETIIWLVIFGIAFGLAVPMASLTV
jgi:hypothetical protein